MKYTSQKWVLKHIGALLLCVLNIGVATAQQNTNWILPYAGLQLSWTQNGLSIDSAFPRPTMNPFATIGDWIKSSTISNASGDLLFCSYSKTIWTNRHEIMLNAPQSPNIGGQNNLILPVPSDTGMFKSYLAEYGGYSNFQSSYLKSFWVSPWYNNLWQSDTGKVLSVDTLFYGPAPNSVYTSDCLSAIKHGNGRDYWVLYHPRLTDSFMIWYQEPNGQLSLPYYQKIGPFFNFSVNTETNHMQLVFNNDGTKMALIMLFNIWILDFDRCTGTLSNPTIIDTCTNCFTELANFTYPSTWYLDGCFSPNGKMFYATRQDSLVQFDLTDFPNSINRTVIWHSPIPWENANAWPIQGLQLGPDRKIYVGTKSNAQPTAQWAPIDSGCSYLGVIEYPNVAGMGCSFNRLGLYLNGYLSSHLLPNIVDYDLGSLIGSPCDTLITTGFSEQNPTPQITLFPNPAQTEATLTWSGMQEGTFVLKDMLGRALLQQDLSTSSGSIKLNLSELPKGIYLWQVQSKAHAHNGKLVVE